ncbi:MAG: helix-turn-helix domain-containing protein [Candidatus Diapherotrites archaeon]
MSVLDFSKPVSFSIVNAMLESKEFTQLALSQNLKVSLGQVNKIVKYFQQKGYIEKGKNSYHLVDPLAIISEIAIHRNMESLLIARFSLSLNNDAVFEILRAKAIFCLDSALSHYFDNIKTKRVCAYLTENDTNLIEKLSALPGDKTHLYLYSIDLTVNAVLENNTRYTDKVRTAIDLVCDNCTFAASRLFQELWGQKVM